MDRSGVEELGARLIQPEDVGEVVWDVVTKPERYHVKLRADRKTISPQPNSSRQITHIDRFDVLCARCLPGGHGLYWFLVRIFNVFRFSWLLRKRV